VNTRDTGVLGVNTSVTGVVGVNMSVTGVDPVWYHVEQVTEPYIRMLVKKKRPKCIF